MTNRQVFFIGLAILVVLIPLFFMLYRKLYAGRPQLGLHIQTASISLAWLGGVLALVLDRVELGAKVLAIGFVIGVIGLFVHTRPAREIDKEDR